MGADVAEHMQRLKCISSCGSRKCYSSGRLTALILKTGQIYRSHSAHVGTQEGSGSPVRRPHFRRVRFGGRGIKVMWNMWNPAFFR